MTSPRFWLRGIIGRLCFRTFSSRSEMVSWAPRGTPGREEVKARPFTPAGFCGVAANPQPRIPRLSEGDSVYVGGKDRCGAPHSSIRLVLSLKSLRQAKSAQVAELTRRPCVRSAVQTTFSAIPLFSGATSAKNGSLPAHSDNQPTATVVTAHVASRGSR
jgi:hypothetical protein